MSTKVVLNLLNREVKQNVSGKVLKQKVKKAKGTFIHSDQRSHYTHSDYQKAVKKMKLKQTMSKRGNFWDNTPKESFFGHFKDQAFIKPCLTLDELKREIKDYMIYYNHYRYQWNLKKMTPVQFRSSSSISLFRVSFT